MAGPGGQEVGRISIRVVPNTDGFRRKLKDDLEAAEAGNEVEIDVEPDVTGLREKIKAAASGVKAEVDVDVKRGSLDRIQGLIRNMTDSISNVKGPGFGSGINPSGYAVIFAGIAALAAPLIGLVTSALLTLPGLIAAVATPIGALLLGMKGLGKAAERLKEPFEALKNSMSDAVEAQFGPVFDQLGKIFPTLERSLPKVTQGMADLAKSFVDTITGPVGQAKIQTTIENIGKAISRAAPGIGSFTNGLLTLAEKFTAKLPSVADWFNKAGDAFDRWITKLDKEGTLSKAFDGLGGTIRTILEGLGKIASKGLEFMNDPKKIENFNQGLKNIADTLGSIVDLSNKLNEAKLFNNMLPSFEGEGIKKDFLAPFTSDDAPWRGMLDGLRSALATVDITVRTFFANLWSSVATGAATAFGTVAATVTSSLSGAFTGIQAAAATAWNGLVSVATSVVGQVVSVFAQIPGQVVGALAGIPAAAAGVFSQVVATASSVLAGVVAVFVNIGAQALAEVSSWPGKIAAALQGLVSTLASIGSQAASALVNALAGGIAAGVGAVAGAVGKLMAAARAMIPNSPAKEGPFSGSGWEAVKNFGGNLVDTLAGGIPSPNSNPLINQIRAVMQAIKEVFGENPNLNLNFNLGGSGGIQSSMSSIADSSAAFQKNMAGSLPAVGKITDETRSQMDDLALQKDQLELQRQQLANEKNATSDKGRKNELQQQIDALTLQKKQLDVQSQQLKMSDQYGTSLEGQNTQYQDMLKSALAIPTDFAKANVDQFLSDFGISGQGAISQALKEGLKFGEQFIFNVGSMDEALAGQQNITNKKALQYNTRG